MITRNKLIISFILIIALTIIFYFTFMFGKTADLRQKEHTINVITQPIKIALMPQKLFAYGQVVTPNSIIIRSEIDGGIEKINFHYGEKVQKGDLLFVIKANDIQSQIEKFKSSLEFAK